MMGLDLSNGNIHALAHASVFKTSLWFNVYQATFGQFSGVAHTIRQSAINCTLDDNCKLAYRIKVTFK